MVVSLRLLTAGPSSPHTLPLSDLSHPHSKPPHLFPQGADPDELIGQGLVGGAQVLQGAWGRSVAVYVDSSQETPPSLPRPYLQETLPPSRSPEDPYLQDGPVHGIELVLHCTHAPLGQVVARVAPLLLLLLACGGLLPGGYVHARGEQGFAMQAVALGVGWKQGQ